MQAITLAVLISGLIQPRAITVGGDGRVYVVTGAAGDAKMMVIEGKKAVPFAEGFDDPRGIAAFKTLLSVADRNQVWKVDAKGKTAVFAAPTAFPTPPKSLTGITIDQENGTVYVCDNSDNAAIYRISPQGKVSAVPSAPGFSKPKSPTALLMDGASHVLLSEAAGDVKCIKLADGSSEPFAGSLGAPTGMARDNFGRLFVADRSRGRILAVPRPCEGWLIVATGVPTDAICLDPTHRQVLMCDAKTGSIVSHPAIVKGFEIDDRPLPLETAIAFPNLQWADWKGETDVGKPNPLRPILLTHPGDGSNRNIVATQHGVIYAFANDEQTTKTEILLDIRDRVSYSDKTNEEGFLGLAFHPKFKENGELFVFYTTKKAKLTNIVSRFRLKRDGSAVVDPASEEELLRFEKPFWNHDGGTICFGSDGYLYITHGDGGSANDPFDNGQKLSSLLGKVLRIDVDRKDNGKNYAIPPDNPFVGQADARPEIWAYGLRNIWRMAFDKKTGQLWAGDVGQNLFEEIDIIVRGGNYGWNRREGLHPFGPKGMGRHTFIEPIWEYHHDIGKSITGGCVYRGAALPEIQGHYLYADYVSGRIWALKYDEVMRRVIANRPIKDRSIPIFSFGEDERGEVYLLTATNSGQGIMRLVRTTDPRP